MVYRKIVLSVSFALVLGSLPDALRADSTKSSKLQKDPSAPAIQVPGNVPAGPAVAPPPPADEEAVDLPGIDRDEIGASEDTDAGIFAPPPMQAAAVAPTCKNPTIPAGVDPLQFANVFQLTRGQTFLSFMQKTVKPKLDQIATSGFQVRDANSVINALAFVDCKVQQELTSAMSRPNLQAVANGLKQLQATDATGAAKEVKFEATPDAPDTFDDAVIDVSNKANIQPKPQFRDALTISTFLALSSGGGVAVRMDQNNIYYNVGYGTGANNDQRVTKTVGGKTITFTQPGDEVTGRSFGAGPVHPANDVSDAAYLGELQQFLTSADATQTGQFYKTLMMILTNSDTSNYANLNPLGQQVSTDFTAVYTAEEDRHLMFGLTKFQFDVALAEVTFSSGFAAGGSKIRMEFNGRLVEQVPNVNRDTKQVVIDSTTGQPKTHAASLQDWTRLSPIPCHAADPRTGNPILIDPSGNPIPAHPGCNRSGPNESKPDRRILQRDLTQFARTDAQLAPLVSQIELLLTGFTQVTGKRVGTEDLFQELTDYLISKNSPAQMPQANQLSTAFANFMVALKTRADEIAGKLEARDSTLQNQPALNQRLQQTTAQEAPEQDRPQTTPETNPQPRDMNAPDSEPGDNVFDSFVGAVRNFFKKL